MSLAELEQPATIHTKYSRSVAWAPCSARKAHFLGFAVSLGRSLQPLVRIYPVPQGSVPLAPAQICHEQEARAKTTVEKLKETVQKRSKALATSVKRIPKSQRDCFVRKVSGS